MSTVDQPLVSVITPTWQRHNLLIDRCMYSVMNQTYPFIEHVIVSDGGDPQLLAELERLELIDDENVIFAQLPNDLRGGRWGSVPRQHGVELSKGDYIAYCDDDDSLRPHHVETLLHTLLAHPEAGFAYSKMASHGAAAEAPGGDIIGGPDLGPCLIGTPMMLHRRDILQFGQWGPPDSMEDWRIIDRWLVNGVTARFVDEVTVDVWPSAYRPGG